MSRQTRLLEKERKHLAVVMAVAGGVIGIASSIQWITREMMGWMGFFLFIVGMLQIKKPKPWSQLSPRQKRIKTILLITLSVLAIAGIILFLVLKY